MVHSCKSVAACEPRSPVRCGPRLFVQYFKNSRHDYTGNVQSEDGTGGVMSKTTFSEYAICHMISPP